VSVRSFFQVLGWLGFGFSGLVWVFGLIRSGLGLGFWMWACFLGRVLVVGLGLGLGSVI